MKIKKIIKVLVFVLLFCTLFVSVTSALVKEDAAGFSTLSEFYAEDKPLDGVYIGSSSCFAYWNSLFAWEEYGISVMPYACNANLFYSTEFLIKECLKTQPDTLFIVNINSLSDGEVDLQQMRNLIDNMPFSINKLQLIDYLSDIGGYSNKDRMEFYFPIIRYHSRWNELTEKELTAEPDRYKGASVNEPYLHIIEDVTKLYINTDRIDELSEKLEYSTNRLLDYCDEADVNVLFVAVPQARQWPIQVGRQNGVKAIIEERGYTVLDMMPKTEEIGINLKKDFYNSHHTNIHGSAKYTYYLSEYLIENYGFEDKRGNEDYKDWDSSLENYLEYVSPYILDIELDSNARDYSIAAPAFELSYDKSKVSLSWQKSEGADGYLVYRKAGDSEAWTQLCETKELGYDDASVNAESKYFYTVVPYAETENGRKYGDFAYQGRSLTT